VTVADGPIAEGNVSATVNPLTTADVGVMFTALAVTVNALAGAVVACNDSLKVSTTVVPFAFSAPDVRVGADMSTPALLWKGYPSLTVGLIVQTADPEVKFQDDAVKVPTVFMSAVALEATPPFPPHRFAVEDVLLLPRSVSSK
jgi:hypothetical protein